MAVGCSHGHLANPLALDMVLRFKGAFRPHDTIHLGDAYDLASLRAGAIANPNDPDSVDTFEKDISHGSDFLSKLRPTVFLTGNHDERALRLMTHHNAMVRGYAAGLWRDMMAPLREMGATVIDQYTVLEKGWFPLGGYLWGHGIFYSESFLRDTAEAYGNSVVAHAHRAGMASGRRIDNPACLSPGTLADVPAMAYAARRRSTLAWSHGVVWGEWCGDKAQLCVTVWGRGEKRWKLPV